MNKEGEEEKAKRKEFGGDVHILRHVNLGQRDPKGTKKETEYEGGGKKPLSCPTSNEFVKEKDIRCP